MQLQLLIIHYGLQYFNFKSLGYEKLPGEFAASLHSFAVVKVMKNILTLVESIVLFIIKEIKQHLDSYSIITLFKKVKMIDRLSSLK